MSARGRIESLEEFIEEVGKLANGARHSARREVIRREDGSEESLWDAWVHPLGWTDPCSTPEEALAQLREEPALGGGW